MKYSLEPKIDLKTFLLGQMLNWSWINGISLEYRNQPKGMGNEFFRLLQSFRELSAMFMIRNGVYGIVVSKTNFKTHRDFLVKNRFELTNLDEINDPELVKIYQDRKFKRQETRIVKNPNFNTMVATDASKFFSEEYVLKIFYTEKDGIITFYNFKNEILKQGRKSSGPAYELDRFLINAQVEEVYAADISSTGAVSSFIIPFNENVLKKALENEFSKEFIVTLGEGMSTVLITVQDKRIVKPLRVKFIESNY